MRVVCCTMYSPSHQELADISVPNLQEYCDIHGYSMKLIEIENDKWEYKKHEGFEKAFKWMSEGDIIWYKDIDSVITNMRIPITDFIDDEHDFFITEDVNELNGGSVILKNSEWGRWLNNMVLSNRDKYENEQNVYNVNRDMLTISGCMKILPHPSINSYDYALYPECGIKFHNDGHWQVGDFVLHAPALPMKKRIGVLSNIKITR